MQNRKLTPRPLYHVTFPPTAPSSEFGISSTSSRRMTAAYPWCVAGCQPLNKPWRSADRPDLWLLFCSLLPGLWLQAICRAQTAKPVSTPGLNPDHSQRRTSLCVHEQERAARQCEVKKHNIRNEKEIFKKEMGNNREKGKRRSFKICPN